MNIDFDRPVDRRNTGSMKWQTYVEDILPMWVADMDFKSPEPVIEALRQRAEHGVFGYALATAELTSVICDRMLRLYRWEVMPEQVIFLPGVVSSINLACRAFAKPGEGILVQTPVYPPFLSAPANQSLMLQSARLAPVVEAHVIRYEIDWGAFERAITPLTRLFILCHPHNPIGTDFSPHQLSRLAEICLRHGVIMVSDEIHCELLLGNTRHTPTATLSPEIADSCITFMAPSKTFNIPGLGLSFAIVTNPDLRSRLTKAGEGILPLMNVFGLTAALSAYRDGDEWLAALLEYLTANRDFLVNYLKENFPQVRTTVPQATYLAWLDCREAGIEGNPQQFFLQNARVALSDGAAFGPGGEGFVRLNFGCPRSQLVEALDRLRDALTSST